MADLFIKYYLEGFGVGCMAVLVLIAMFFYIYHKEKQKARKEEKKEPVKPVNADASPTNGFAEKGRYLMMIGIIFCVLYVWITPMPSFSGRVEGKSRQVSGRKTKTITYFLSVQGENRIVDKEIYEIANTGDEITHRFASHFYYINSQRYCAVQFAWNTAFWGGVLLMALLVLCIGSLWFGGGGRGKTLARESDPSDDHRSGSL